MSETQQCPNCGTPNSVGRSLCRTCNTALTAYAGELAGETYSGKLASQVAAIETRPIVAPIMAAFLGLLIIIWPVNHLHVAFAGRPVTNSDGTNYMAAAVGTIGPIFASIFFIPVAAALGIAIWGVLTQRLWAWYSGLIAVVLGAIVLKAMIASTAVWVIFLLALIGLAAAWSQRSVRDWYGVG